MKDRKKEAVLDRNGMLTVGKKEKKEEKRERRKLEKEAKKRERLEAKEKAREAKEAVKAEKAAAASGGDPLVKTRRRAGSIFGRSDKGDRRVKKEQRLRQKEEAKIQKTAKKEKAQVVEKKKLEEENNDLINKLEEELLASPKKEESLPKKETEVEQVAPEPPQQSEIQEMKKEEEKQTEKEIIDLIEQLGEKERIKKEKEEKDEDEEIDEEKGKEDITIEELNQQDSSLDHFIENLKSENLTKVEQQKIEQKMHEKEKRGEEMVGTIEKEEKEEIKESFVEEEKKEERKYVEEENVVKEEIKETLLEEEKKEERKYVEEENVVKEEIKETLLEEEKKEEIPKEKEADDEQFRNIDFPSDLNTANNILKELNLNIGEKHSPTKTTATALDISLDSIENDFLTINNKEQGSVATVRFGHEHDQDNEINEINEINAQIEELNKKEKKKKPKKKIMSTLDLNNELFELDILEELHNKKKEAEKPDEKELSLKENENVVTENITQEIPKTLLPCEKYTIQPPPPPPSKTVDESKSTDDPQKEEKDDLDDLDNIEARILEKLNDAFGNDFSFDTPTTSKSTDRPPPPPPLSKSADRPPPPPPPSKSADRPPPPPPPSGLDKTPKPPSPKKVKESIKEEEKAKSKQSTGKSASSVNEDEDELKKIEEETLARLANKMAFLDQATIETEVTEEKQIEMKKKRKARDEQIKKERELKIEQDRLDQQERLRQQEEELRLRREKRQLEEKERKEREAAAAEAKKKNESVYSNKINTSGSWTDIDKIIEESSNHADKKASEEEKFRQSLIDFENELKAQGLMPHQIRMRLAERKRQNPQLAGQASTPLHPRSFVPMARVPKPQINLKVSTEQELRKAEFTKNVSPHKEIPYEPTNEKQADESMAGETEAREWIEKVLEETLPDGPLSQVLKSGIILCNLLNKIRPGSITRVSKMTAPFIQMENINMFIKGCVKLGMRPSDCFIPSDLYEVKNMNLVISSIHNLARLTSALATNATPDISKPRSHRNSIISPMIRQRRGSFSYAN